MSDYTEAHARSQGADFPTLEVWPNQYANRDYSIEVDTPEFTCLCPKTGQPDFADITIRYVPDQVCLELKALKLYLQHYRGIGIFHENVVNQIRDDIVQAADPRWLEVIGEFNPRGGLQTTVSAEYLKEGGVDA